jgi:integrase
MARGSIKTRQTRSAVVYDVTYDLPGTDQQRHQRRRTFATRRDAERFLARELAAIDRGERIHTRAVSFADYATEWLAAKRPRLEASTYRDYETHLRLRLIPALGRLRIDRISRAHIEAYLADLDARAGAGRKVINDSLIPLRQILGRAVRERLIVANPAASTDRDAPLELPYEAPAMRTLTRDQTEGYLREAWAVRHAPERDPAERAWYGPVAEVLLGAGLRIGEALALEWRDVDLDGASLRIERTRKLGGVGTPKGNRPRTVFIGPALADVLRQHRRESGRIAGLVFPSLTGTHLDHANVRRRGHEVAVRNAGIDAGLRLHDLRHTYAKLALASGASIYFVKEQLGHADIQTTIDLYGHPDQAEHRRQAAQLETFWREERPPTP